MNLNKKISTLLTILCLGSIAPSLYAAEYIGEDCENASNHDFGGSNEYSLAEGQTSAFIKFSPAGQNITIELSAVEGLNYINFKHWYLYKLGEGCESMELIVDEDNLDVSSRDHFSLYNLEIDGDYRFKLDRQEPAQEGEGEEGGEGGEGESEFAKGSFKFQTRQKSAISCPTSYTSNCGEMVKNGDFSNLTESNFADIRRKDPFNSTLPGHPNPYTSQVCEWSALTNHAQINDNSTRAVSFWSEYYSTGSFSESIIQPISLSTSKEYFFSFKVREMSGRALPEEVRIALIDLSTFGTPPTNFLLHNQPQQNIITVTKNDIQTNPGNSNYNFATYSTCFQPTSSSYDDLIIYAYNTAAIQPPGATAHGWVEFDDISIIDLSLATAGEDLNACTNDRVIGPGCIIPNADYTWSPSTGLSDHKIANPVANPAVNTDYTLTITLPGNNNCSQTTSVTDMVHVDALITNSTINIPSNSNVAWIQNNVTNSTFQANDQTFYVEGILNIDQNYVFANCSFYMAPNARINVSSGVTLDFIHMGINLTPTFMKTCDPNDFWDGIYVDGTLQINHWAYSLNGEGLTISNMQNGINLDNSTGVNYFETVQFDRNNKSISISNNTVAAVDITNTSFDCSTPLVNQGGGQYFPTNAVEVVNHQGGAINIKTFCSFPGNICTGGVLFRGKGGALHIDRSSVNIGDDVGFRDFDNTYSLPGTHVNEKAIDILGGFNPSDNIGTININWTSFYNNNSSIKSIGDVILNIANNHNNGGLRPNSKFLVASENDEQIVIRNNGIINVTSAISMYNSGDIEIKDNAIDLETQSGFFFTNKTNLASSAITIGNYTLTGTQDISIHDNSISHAKVGIYVNFCDANIYDNTISDLNDNFNAGAGCFPFPCTAPEAFAIRALNTTNGYDINRNTIRLTAANYNSNPETNNKVHGISVENSVNANNVPTSVRCNIVGNTGIGVRFVGSQEPGTVYERNELEGHKYGLVLKNGAVVTNIGDPTGGGENEWNYTTTSSLRHTYSDHTNGSLTTIYARGSGNSTLNLNPLIATTDHSQTTGSSSIAEITSSQANGGTSCYCLLYRLRGGTIAPLVELPNTAKQFANGDKSNIFFAGDSLLRLNKQLLNRQVHSNEIEDEFWLDFSDRFVDRDRLASKENYSESEIQELLAVASECPYYEGIKVYDARIILKSLGHSVNLNECEITEFNPTLATNMAVRSSVEIYPNPSQGNIRINFEVEEDNTVFLDILTMDGKLVQQERLQKGSSNEIELSLTKGVYLCRIHNAKEILSNQKLIIN